MSLMRMSHGGAEGSIDVKCTGFNTQLIGEMQSVQLKEQMHYFPIKANQPAVRFELIFSSQEEWESFQDWVRASHLWAVRTVENPEVTFYWPERGINNWTGMIKELRAGASRFTWAPKATIEVLLVDSMLSQKTWTSSFGEEFRKFFESNMSDPRPGDEPPLTPPTQPPGGGVLDGNGPGGIDLTDPFGLNNRGR